MWQNRIEITLRIIYSIFQFSSTYLTTPSPVCIMRKSLIWNSSVPSSAHLWNRKWKAFSTSERWHGPYSTTKISTFLMRTESCQHAVFFFNWKNASNFKIRFYCHWSLTVIFALVGNRLTHLYYINVTWEW